MIHVRQPPRSPGLGASLRRIGGSVLHVVQTRLEILSTEIAEERYNLTQAALVAFGVLLCLQAGTLLAALFVALVVGRAHWLAAIGIAALVLLFGALGGVLWLRWWLKSRPPMFASTIAELRRDRDRLACK